jgi:hypothetical protein
LIGRLKLSLLMATEIAGIFLMSYGAWLWQPPAGFFLAGLLLYAEVNNVFKIPRTTRD